MKGDDRTRHCTLCELSVHNVAGMTRDEVSTLVAQVDGRLCVRLLRRADGTIMTKDCPVGLRAYRKRVAGVAGAALATILGFFSLSYGQKEESVKTVDASKIEIVRSRGKVGSTTLRGTLVDMNGAVIPGTDVYLLGTDRKIAASSDADGTFSFVGVAPGRYNVEVSAARGFRKLLVQNVDLDTSSVHDIILELDADYEELVGDLMLEGSGTPEISPIPIDFSLLKITPRPVKKP